jgi:thioredoxin reductase (NADPH)
MPFKFFDCDSESGQQFLSEAGLNGKKLPVMIRHDGKVYIQPTNSEVIEAFGGGTRIDSREYDVAIIGAGPAGLAAAVYAASEGLKTIALEKHISGGQAGSSSLIRNFPGFTWGIGGHDLTFRACQQAWLFGANMVFAKTVTKVIPGKSEHILRIDDGREVCAKTVIISIGVSWRRLGIPKLESLIGTGVFYGAAMSEAQAMLDQNVCVIGAGNSAGQAAAHLAKYATSVTMLVRGESLKKSMSEYLITELKETPNIHIRLGVKLVDGEGDVGLEALIIKNKKTGKLERIETSALFVLIGAIPKTDWLADTVARSPKGFILTGNDVIFNKSTDHKWPLKRQPLSLETSVPGIFAAGDVRYRSVKRVASAVGEGSIAVQHLHQYFADQTLKGNVDPHHIEAETDFG